MSDTLTDPHLDKRAAETAGLPMQMAFQNQPQWELAIPKGIDLNLWAAHLAHTVSREPINLINHVRRIRLHLALKEADALFGAILDLHLALNEKGVSLRGNLLRQSKKILSQDHYDLFLTHYKQGLQPNQSLPPSRYSVLGNFFTGNKVLVKKENAHSSPNPDQHDPLELAREELKYGDISKAQQILEEALIQAPKTPELHHELLEVYSHTRSLEDLIRMQETLGDNIAIALDEWNQTLNKLKN
ncbi:MAG: hypothetical protein AAES65_01375 [Candidatus Thiodiazotropha sp. (ex. Lucinoma kazani)]